MLLSTTSASTKTNSRRTGCAYDVMEVLVNGIYVVRNKRTVARYRVRGRTHAGRALELIVIVEGSRKLRFLTGWDL